MKALHIYFASRPDRLLLDSFVVEFRPGRVSAIEDMANDLARMLISISLL